MLNIWPNGEEVETQDLKKTTTTQKSWIRDNTTFMPRDHSLPLRLSQATQSNTPMDMPQNMCSSPLATARSPTARYLFHMGMLSVRYEEP